MSAVGKSRNLLDLLSVLTPVKVTRFVTDSGSEELDEREDAEFFAGANVVTSRRGSQSGWFKPKHAVLLDLDVPAYLVPSSTPGHSHLYIDVECEEKDYYAFLDAAAKIGVIESGYVEASKKKGGTHLRLPWVNKFTF